MKKLLLTLATVMCIALSVKAQSTPMGLESSPVETELTTKVKKIAEKINLSPERKVEITEIISGFNKKRENLEAATMNLTDKAARLTQLDKLEAQSLSKILTKEELKAVLTIIRI